MEKEPFQTDEQRRVSDLRHLYRSLTRMIRSDAVDTLLNHIVEDIVESTSLQRMVVLYYNQQDKAGFFTDSRKYRTSRCPSAR